MKKHSLLGLCVAIVLGAGAAQAQQVKVDNYPEGVPCDSLQKNADGSWTVKSIIVGSMTMQNTTLKGGSETQVWETKCGSKK